MGDTIPQFVFVWIRHAEKAYQNSRGPPGSYAHDPPIVKDDIKNIMECSKKLIEVFGFPTKCIASPYLRCRQTAGYLTSHIPGIKIDIDVNISEHLGFQRNRDLQPDVAPSTIKCTDEPLPVVRETKDQLIKRISKHLDIMLSDKNGVKWIVTHGIAIDYIYEYLKTSVTTDIELPPNVDTLGVMYLVGSKEGLKLGIL